MSSLIRSPAKRGPFKARHVGPPRVDHQAETASPPNREGRVGQRERTALLVCLSQQSTVDKEYSNKVNQYNEHYNSDSHNCINARVSSNHYYCDCERTCSTGGVGSRGFNPSRPPTPHSLHLFLNAFLHALEGSERGAPANTNNQTQ